MKTAIVALAEGTEAPGGFAVDVARALEKGGHPCTLIWVFPYGAPSASQTPVPGLEVIYVRRGRSGPRWLPDFRLPQLSYQIAPMLRRFDVVYGLLTGHPLMGAIRERRFSSSQVPLFVTIVKHLPKTALESAVGLTPRRSDREFGERYQLRHSDYVVCCHPLGADRLEARNWKLPRRDRIGSTQWN